MIKRYSRKEMSEIWEEENRYRNWLKVEIVIIEGWAKIGVIPKKDLLDIKRRFKKVQISQLIKRAKEIEAEIHHDLLAFVEALSEKIGPLSKYIHLGITSSDILDTSLSLSIVQSADLLIADLKELKEALKEKSKLYKDLVMAGRTHGIQAEPITLGLKFCSFYSEIERSLERIERAKEVVRVGKVSGACGTYANLDPQIEIFVCKKLNLIPEKVSTQIIGRDRYAEFLSILALVSSSIERMATEIRHLQRTEIGEVEEPFVKGQKGSSTMPHKRNPIICERICGLSRVIRANSLAGLEDINLWNERDISHSSVERIIFPDSTILLDYIINKFIGVIKGLSVHPERIEENLKKSSNLIFSSNLLFRLCIKGVRRKEAYQMVQKVAMEANRKKKDFKMLALSDTKIRKYLSKDEINETFSSDYSLRHIPEIYKRLFFG